jgi:anti-sigma factor RsiW
VTTCGYGDLQGGNTEDRWYTSQFSGTSSASPVIVGALGCAQGVLRGAKRIPMSPAVARSLLRSSGSAQQPEQGRPITQRIGPRPDLASLVPSLLLTQPVIRSQAKTSPSKKSQPTDKQ